MKTKFSNLLPSMRWIPHDIDEKTTREKENDKTKKRAHGRSQARRSILFRSYSTEPNHGTPARRKSTLSLASAADNEVNTRLLMQGQSRFFTMLPIEVRKMVYEFVVGAETVHLTLGAKRRFGHFVCASKEQEGHKARRCECRVLVGGAGEGTRLNRGCLGLVSTCRRLYDEALPHLYAPHIFSLLHITHLLYLPTRIPLPRLSTIRTFHLRYTLRGLPYFRRSQGRYRNDCDHRRLAYPEDTSNWEKAWKIMGSMRGIQGLRVTIVDPSKTDMWEPQWLALEDLLLEAARSVLGVRTFEIVLPYQTCREDWDMGESGALLMRPVRADDELGG